MYINETTTIKVLIKTKSSDGYTPHTLSVNSISRQLSQINGKILYTGKRMPYIIALIPLYELENIKKNPEVLEVEIDVILNLHYINESISSMISPNSVLLSEAVNSTKVTELWNKGITGKNVKIAIVDTGIKKTHPMFLDNNGVSKVINEIAFGCVYNSYDDWARGQCSTSLDPSDDFVGHGTATASCAAGYQWNTPDGILYGASPDAKLININVSDKVYDSQSGTYFSILSTINLFKGIDWLFFSGGGADIVSMSFGSDIPLKVMRNIINLIISNNSIPVASIGNSGPYYVSSNYPGGFQECISCGSHAIKTLNFNGASTFSSRGPGYNACIKPDFLSPGGNKLMDFEIEGSIGGDEMIITASPSGYVEIRGTSFSCPIIAGVLACLKEKYNFKKIYALKSKTNDEGFGLIDAIELENNLISVTNNYSISKQILHTNYEPYIFKGDALLTPSGVILPTPYRINNKLLIYYANNLPISEITGCSVFEYNETDKTIIDYGIIITDSTIIPGIVYYNNKYYSFYTYYDSTSLTHKLARMESNDGIQWTNKITILDTLPEIINYPAAVRLSLRTGAIILNNIVHIYLSNSSGTHIQYILYNISTNNITETGIAFQFIRATQPVAKTYSYKFDYVDSPYCYIDGSKIVMIVTTSTQYPIYKPTLLARLESIDGKLFTVTNVIEPSEYNNSNFLWGFNFGTFFENKIYYTDGNYSNWIYMDKLTKIYID